MINAGDLRIGNWVNVPHGNVQIEKFINYGVHFADGCGGNFASLEPIPLTPEILGKAGFGYDRERDEFNFVNENTGTVLCLGENYVKDGRPVFYDNLPQSTSNEFKCIAYCKYVHQLQNLYHSLIGEELTIDFK